MTTTAAATVRRGRRATPGRASERNLLYSAVDAPVARERAALSSSCEPGMGKSHLLSDLAARTGREHGEGALILVVDAAVENAADPLAVWRPAVLRAARMLLRDVAPPAEAKPDVTADVLIALLPEELRWARAALERVLMPPDERKVADTRHHQRPSAAAALTARARSATPGNPINGILQKTSCRTRRAHDVSCRSSSANAKVSTAHAILRATAERKACVVLDSWHAAKPGPTVDVRDSRAGGGATALFVLATRPYAAWAARENESREAQARLCAREWTTVLALAPLSEDAIAALALNALHGDGMRTADGAALREAGGGSLTPRETRERLRTLHAWCGGNPLFAKLLLPRLVSEASEIWGGARAPGSGSSSVGRGESSTAPLPAALCDIVISQLDRLPLSEQLLAKMACALAHWTGTFERSALQALYPGSTAELDAALATLSHHHYIVVACQLPTDVRYALCATAVAHIVYSLMLAEQRGRTTRRSASFTARAPREPGLPAAGARLVAVAAT